MGRICAVLCALGLGCGAATRPTEAPAPHSLPSEEGAIAHVLDDWHAAAASADEARYFGHLASDAVFLGTDATERWDKAAFQKYAHPHFAKGKAWSFKAVRRSVVFDRQDLAHFDEELATKGLGPARGSGVVAKREGVWKIVHYNLTITVPNDRFDAAKEAATTAELLVSSDAALASVALLTGSWIGTDAKGGTIEEHWTQASAGSMLGVGKTSRSGKTEFFELLRIEARPNGDVVYLAQPLGKPATEFKRTQADATSVSFENPTHDWPKRLSYRRTHAGLTVRIEGGPGEPVEEWTMRPALVVRKPHE